MAIEIKRNDGSVVVMRLDDAALNALSPEQLANTVAAEIAKWTEADRAAVVSWSEVLD
jgi:hypothetical protein